MSDEQTPGPALDARVAEQVMGWGFAPFEMDIRDWRAPDGTLHADVPPYSTEIAAAWQVVEHLRTTRPPWQFSCEDDQTIMVWYATFSDYRTQQRYTRVHASMPLAICRAALAAIESEATP